MNRLLRDQPVVFALGFSILIAATHCWAAGFASQTQSGSGLGNAYAGGAAVAEDAAVVWYNPAAMSRLSGTHFAVAGYAINNNREWQDKGSTASGGNVGLGAGAKMSQISLVPNLFLVHQLNPKTHIGLALNTPFGLKTEYNKDWLGRYQGVGSDIRTLNVSGTAAYRLTPQFSVAAGINWQKLDAELTQMQNYAALVGGAAASLSFRESLTKIEGSDASWGYNLGAHWAIDDKSAVGLHYRSAIHFHLTGDVKFERPNSSIPAINASLASNLADGGVTANITVPAMAHLSGLKKLGPRWDFMADLMWTQWSTVPKLEFERAQGGILSTTAYNWKDTFRYSVGANYQLASQWKLRAGLAYDESPIPAQYRTARLPDNNRIWLSSGVEYKLTSQFNLNLGYTYVMVQKADLNNRREDNDPTGTRSGTLNGTFQQHVHILGAQLNYRF
ncbi:OmpP1/FadL family transporter [Parvibium lacunae]|uniref:Transporter n=1 Tax=Parvibium lacunae TaxID=1888893 RepID=A0A368L4P7_9BURK|nr:outer membrane protein transport protein [Parvibium lacunae]RCS58549.1 transporter [Parvibium lacunae]